MTAADRIFAARALIEPLTKLHDAATPGDLSTAEVTDEDEWFGCPHCSGVGEVRADQYINYDGVAANVLFSGVGHEFGANRDWYLAVCRDWPKVRDTVAALADLADAQAQENARLREALDPNHTKADYIGEFKERVYFGTDEEGNEIWQYVTISWDVIKQIMAAIRARAALAAMDTPKGGGDERPERPAAAGADLRHRQEGHRYARDRDCGVALPQHKERGGHQPEVDLSGSGGRL